MNYYNILGVDPSASYREVKKAYGKLVRANRGNPEIAIQISEAYEILKDPVKRMDYNRKQGIAVEIESDEAFLNRIQATREVSQTDVVGNEGAQNNVSREIGLEVRLEEQQPRIIETLPRENGASTRDSHGQRSVRPRPVQEVEERVQGKPRRRATRGKNVAIIGGILSGIFCIWIIAFFYFQKPGSEVNEAINIVLNVESMILEEGQGALLEEEVLWDKNLEGEVEKKYFSTDSAVVTISDLGIIRAVKAGHAEVGVVIGIGGKTYSESVPVEVIGGQEDTSKEQGNLEVSGQTDSEEGQELEEPEEEENEGEKIEEVGDQLGNTQEAEDTLDEQTKPEANKKPEAGAKPKANKKPEAEVKPEANKKPEAEVKPEVNQNPVPEIELIPETIPQGKKVAEAKSITYGARVTQEDLKVHSLIMEPYDTFIKCKLTYESSINRHYRVYEKAPNYNHIKDGVLPKTTGSKTFEFAIDKKKAVDAGTIVMRISDSDPRGFVNESYLEIKGDDVAMLYVVAEKSVGNPVKIDFERDLIQDGIKIHQLMAQEYETYVEFTLKYETDIRRQYSFFHPPNGDKLMISGTWLEPTTKPSYETFKVDKVKLKGLDFITMRFYNYGVYDSDEENSNFIFLDMTDIRKVI